MVVFGYGNWGCVWSAIGWSGLYKMVRVEERSNIWWSRYTSQPHQISQFLMVIQHYHLKSAVMLFIHLVVNFSSSWWDATHYISSSSPEVESSLLHLRPTPQSIVAKPSLLSSSLPQRGWFRLHYSGTSAFTRRTHWWLKADAHGRVNECVSGVPCGTASVRWCVVWEQCDVMTCIERVRC